MATAKKKPASKSKAKKPVAKKATKKVAPKAAPKKTAPKKAAPKKTDVKTAKKATAGKPAVVKSTPLKSAKVLDLSGFITPLDDRVLVQTAGAEKMTAGGLYIPDTVSDVSGNLQGFVVSVGRGHVSPKGHLRPMDLKVGDKVVFSQHAGSKIRVQDHDLLILRETEVLGVVGS